MKKIILLVIAFISVTLYAQDIKTVYVNMPDSLSPLLTKVNREDFADFLESNMRAQVKNKFEGNSEMKTLTQDYLFVQTTPYSSLQMKLLPVGETEKIVCVVNTVDGPASDSSVSFYSTDWHELLVSDYLKVPDVEDFFIVSDTIDREQQEWARKKADMNLMKIELSPENTNLHFTYTTIDYMDKESAEELKPLLKSEPLVYEWTEERKYRLR